MSTNNVNEENSCANDNSWENAVWHIDDDTITTTYANVTTTYADIAYACVDDAADQDVAEEQQSTCIYDELCSAKKMCGDCCADTFERERDEQCWENFKMDRKFYNL